LGKTDSFDMTPTDKFAAQCASGEVAGPCSTAAIARAEEALGVTFPDQYRAFLSIYGAALIPGFELYGLPETAPDEPPLWEDVIRVNQSLRSLGQAGADNPDFVAIASDGFGTYFYLDTSVAPETRIVAVGPGIHRDIACDLFSFALDMQLGKITL